MISRLARRYARALLSLAKDAGQLDAIGADLDQVDQAFQDERLRTLIGSPLVDATKRVEIAKKILGAIGVSPLVLNLTCLLAERDRLLILPDVARSYAAMLDAELGRTRAEIRTAAPLDASQEEALRTLATRLANTREVVISAAVEPELLGGVVLDIGGTVYDGSVRTQLNRLSKNMTGSGV